MSIIINKKQLKKQIKKQPLTKEKKENKVKKPKISPMLKEEKVERILSGVYLTDDSPKNAGYLGLLIQLSKIGKEVSPMVEGEVSTPFFSFLESVEERANSNTEVKVEEVTEAIEPKVEKEREGGDPPDVEVEFL